MALTVNAKTYLADSFQKDIVSYIGPLKAVAVMDDIKLSRTVAKPTLTFSGVGRSQAKLTRSFTLTGALTPKWDSIMTVDFVLPVGAADADINALINDFAAWLASSQYKNLVKSYMINQ